PETDRPGPEWPYPFPALFLLVEVELFILCHSRLHRGPPSRSTRSFQALLQRIRQRLVGRRLPARALLQQLLPLRLRLVQLHHACRILVAVLLGLEFARERIDELLRHLELACIELAPARRLQRVRA